eukprot:CAMPEP_0116888608 /NCGR_PEP_ID=MMETSP0463-20121206/23721_1 /TAXON_ID=181622 /ORGANISM="Strombidinopsis sp, Strain SopsisLIS2011" /LENGTH=63 /DNA_ID=CAMNT_0004553725 /DNA_START=22 /DNA_END=214 /DNA_ORIENTATION=-
MTIRGENKWKNNDIKYAVKRKLKKKREATELEKKMKKIRHKQFLNFFSDFFTKYDEKAANNPA